MKDLLGNAAFLTLLGTVFGGVGLKVVESWLSRAQARQDQGAALRAELRLEIESLRNQLAGATQEEQRLEALIDKWQGAYYDLRDEKQQVLTNLTIALDRIKQLEKKLGLDDDNGK